MMNLCRQFSESDTCGTIFFLPLARLSGRLRKTARGKTPNGYSHPVFFSVGRVSLVTNSEMKAKIKKREGEIKKIPGRNAYTPSPLIMTARERATKEKNDTRR